MRVIAPDLDAITAARPGERKLGEACWRAPAGADWQSSIDLARATGVRFVLIGVPEDIGVRANFGVAGAAAAWQCALPAIANVQSNRFLSGTDVWIAGECGLGDIDRRAGAMLAGAADIAALRSLVAEVDQILESVLVPVFSAGLHPVVIGGGNNNSLPILRALSKAARAVRSNANVHVLNCDPHADFRAMEGRHSGNPFRHAIEEGTLDRYFALLLHRSYNSESMLAAMDATRVDRGSVASNWFDDVIDGTTSLDAALEEGVAFVQGGDAIGLELDCDAIAGFPTSAYTPSGLTVDQARTLMARAARRLQPRYLHLSEAAPSRTADGEVFTRKAIAYLVTDHLRAMGAASLPTGG